MGCKPILFLSGPITGLSYEEATCWRNKVADALDKERIMCLSPMRGFQELLGNETEIKPSYPDSVTATDAAITDQDYFDIARSDALLVNLLGTKKVSIGTVCEIAWAFTLRKPLILLIEKENNIHEHPIIRRITTYRTDKLDEAIYLAKRLLLPD